MDQKLKYRLIKYKFHKFLMEKYKQVFIFFGGFERMSPQHF